jgi:hypothetical protein
MKTIKITNYRSLEEVQRYLPEGWNAVIAASTANDEDVIVAWGEERAGWTVDGYIIPRLASGLIVAKEIV